MYILLNLSLSLSPFSNLSQFISLSWWEGMAATALNCGPVSSSTQILSLHPNPNPNPNLNLTRSKQNFPAPVVRCKANNVLCAQISSSSSSPSSSSSSSSSSSDKVSFEHRARFSAGAKQSLLIEEAQRPLSNFRNLFFLCFPSVCLTACIF